MRLTAWYFNGSTKENKTHESEFCFVHSAGRSQMAPAFFKQLSGDKVDHGLSAPTQHGEGVHPEVVAVMNEIGIDLSNSKPKLLTDELAKDADLLITMGCGEPCPYVPGLKREDWPLTDPKGKSLDEVRMIRDEITRSASESKYC